MGIIDTQAGELALARLELASVREALTDAHRQTATARDERDGLRQQVEQLARASTVWAEQVAAMRRERDALAQRCAEERGDLSRAIAALDGARALAARASGRLVAIRQLTVERLPAIERDAALGLVSLVSEHAMSLIRDILEQVRGASNG